MRPSNRRGFTLVELLVVAVVGALVVAATYQVLLVNQRTYAANTAQIQGQETVRAGMDVLYGELRELSSSGGDILAFGGDSLKVRVMRHFGVVCSRDVAAGQLTVVKVGDWFEAEDSVVVFADTNASITSDDTWLLGKVSSRDTTVTCSGNTAQLLSVPVVASAAAGAGRDTVQVGAPLRSFLHYTYGLYTVSGEPYLARKETSGGLTTTVPLVGPLRETNGLHFTFYDTLGAVATTASSIAQVEVTLRTLSKVRGPDGNYVADSITTRIYTRN